jgi:DNA-binding NtrC family response regulator
MPRGTNRRLLVIDDDHGFLDLIRSIFQHSDFDIRCVDKPAEAVNAMREQNFPVVLLDYQLPIVNGNQLIAVLQEINPRTRFIILTGVGGEEVEEKFKGLGYFAFFEKGSLQVEKLREKIQAAFSY